MESQGLFKYLKGDRGIWVIVFLLSILSILAIYSSTGTLAQRTQGGNTFYYFFKQLLMVFFALGAMFIAHKIPYTWFSRIANLLIIIAFFLLAITLIVAPDVNDAKRWLPLPMGLSFQTSDLAKLAVVLYVSRVLSKYQKQIKERGPFLRVLLPPLACCLLIFPANLSTSLILLLTVVVMMLLGGIGSKYLFSLLIMGLAAGSLFVGVLLFVPEKSMPMRFATWKSRLENFGGNDKEANYQTEQAKIAIARGGILGQLPGNSTQRNFLPHPYSDYIFAIIVEEYGLVGGTFVLLLYLFLFYRVIQIARKCKGYFGSFAALGISFLLVFQALINMGVAVDLLPVTGQPLPMLSMGGTSTIFTAFGIGIILSISVSVDKETKKQTEFSESSEADI